jgi:hypothetical protein
MAAEQNGCKNHDYSFYVSLSLRKVWSVDLAKNIPAMTTNGKYAKLEPFYAIVIGLILAKVDKMYPLQVSTD